MFVMFFVVGFLAHLIGDFLIQTEYEATNKPNGHFINWPLLQHVVKYTLCLAVVIIALGASYWWVLWIFATHYVLDRRIFIIWWRKNIMRSSDESIKNTFWLTIIVDQIFHWLVIAVIAAFQ